MEIGLEMSKVHIEGGQEVPQRYVERGQKDSQELVAAAGGDMITGSANVPMSIDDKIQMK